MRNPRNDPLTPQIRGKARDPIVHRGAGGTPVPDRAGPHGAREGGLASARTAPERKCILTGRHDTRGDLIRLAISPEGDVLPDVLARAPGRGAWIGVTRSQLDQAMAKGKLKGALARAFKGTALTIPADLGDRIETALRRALTDRLGIELRAGMIVLGTEKIAAAARAGVVTFLGHASDAGGDGAGKLAQAWRVGEMAEGSGMKGMILPLDRAALSVALGRDNVVHLALTDAAAAARVTGLLGRLAYFTQGDGAGEPADDGSAAMASGTAGPGDDIDTKGK
jgi:predicted RNA-binding protein YlxR (DUF448 family)